MTKSKKKNYFTLPRNVKTISGNIEFKIGTVFEMIALRNDGVCLVEIEGKAYYINDALPEIWSKIDNAVPKMQKH